MSSSQIPHRLNDQGIAIESGIEKYQVNSANCRIAAAHHAVRPVEKPRRIRPAGKHGILWVSDTRPNVYATVRPN